MENHPFAVFGLLTLGSCQAEMGSIAVVRRRTGLGLPGGKVERGETPEEALRREFVEEAAADVVVQERLFEDCVAGNIVRTYRVTLGEKSPPEWATPDELVEGQSLRDLSTYNLSVMLAAGMPLAALGEAAWIAALGPGPCSTARPAAPPTANSTSTSAVPLSSDSSGTPASSLDSPAASRSPCRTRRRGRRRSGSHDAFASLDLSACVSATTSRCG